MATKSKALAAGQVSCSERREPLTLWSLSSYDVNKHLAAAPDEPKPEVPSKAYPIRLHLRYPREISPS